MPEALPDDIRGILAYAEQSMGFTPNDVLIMARWPALLQAMLPLVATIYAPGQVDMQLKRLVGLVASDAGGCRYCVAHNAHGLGRDGIAAAKLAAVWEFESSELFDPAERAALRFAIAAAQPSANVTDADFGALRAYFDDQQIMEITAVVALFGFLNRWNSSLAVTLEAAPLDFARAQLDAARWQPGLHAPDD